LYDHWEIDAHWAVIKPMIFSSLPADKLDEIADPVREQVRRDLHGQGLGRHSPDELSILAKADLQALSERLGERPFWFGETLTSADAAIGPQIATIAGDPVKGPLYRALQAHPNLLAYSSRVLETALPEQMARLAA
jgi:glutathione S-transferase